MTARVRTGQINYQNGVSSEASVERVYIDRGYDLLERRWRGASGEVDLIFYQQGALVFVEVKHSATFDAAAERLSSRQLARICRAAEEYAAAFRGRVDVLRIDAGLVNQLGEVRLLENITL